VENMRQLIDLFAAALVYFAA